MALSTNQIGPPHVATLETTEGGKEEVVANEFSPTEVPLEQVQLPTDWSRGGRLIAFDTGLGEEEQECGWLHAVTVEIPLRFGEPKPLFRIAGTP